MKQNAKKFLKDSSLLKKTGRVHLVVLSLLIIAAGLFLDKWWWQIGGVILIVVITETILHNSVLD